MAKLDWNNPAPRVEHGTDRGVFYPVSGPGVAWPGLTSVDESVVGGERESFHFEGIKYADIVGNKFFQATITARSTPPEFGPCIGERSVVPGFILTRQTRERFGLSYRTLIGDDLGYKIHVVYNALTSPPSKEYVTESNEAPDSSNSWRIDCVPIVDSHFRPTAHFTIDSTRTSPDILEQVEGVLYGTESRAPSLPTFDALVELVTLWEPKIIIPQEVTGLADLVPGIGDLTPTWTDGLYRVAPATTRLVETAESGLYRLE